MKNSGSIVFWSSHRIATLNSYPKRFRIRYLFADWRPNASEAAKIAARLNGLGSEASIAGIIIHQRIRHLIGLQMADIEIALPVEKEIEGAMREFANIVEIGAAESKVDIRLRKVRILRQFLGEEITRREVEFWQAHIRECIETWYAASDVKFLLEHHSFLSPRLVDPPDPIFTMALGVPAYLKTDAVANQGTKWTVYDWKSGAPGRSDLRQALAYDIFIRKEFHLSEGLPVGIKFVFLQNGEVRNVDVTDEDRTNFLWQVAEEHADLTLATVEPKKLYARPGAHCSSCPFQTICVEGAQFLKNESLSTGSLWIDFWLKREVLRAGNQTILSIIPHSSPFLFRKFSQMCLILPLNSETKNSENFIESKCFGPPLWSFSKNNWCLASQGLSSLCQDRVSNSPIRRERM